MSKGQTTADDDDLRVDEARRSTLAARLRPAARRGCDRYRLTGERTVSMLISRGSMIVATPNGGVDAWRRITLP
jgi:hypothetical protein